MGGYPTEATSGGDGFGKGVQTDDTAFGIDRKIRGNEGVEESKAGRFRSVVVLEPWLGIL